MEVALDHPSNPVTASSDALVNLVILCGGRGVRFDSIYPKPLNLVNGKPMIYHMINSLHLEKITRGFQLIVIFNKKLEGCNFKETLQQLFPKIQFHFVLLDYHTRGASESAYLGLKQAIELLRSQPQSSESAKTLHALLNNNIIILDNDSVYPSDAWQQLNTPFAANVIWTNYNHDKDPVYSYVIVDENNMVSDIQEKKKISDVICVGGYGFLNYSIFFRVFEVIISHNIKTQNEFYMSLIFQYMTQHPSSKELDHYAKEVTTVDGQRLSAPLTPLAPSVANLPHPHRIQSVLINKILCMGTPGQLLAESPCIHPLRYVFDLDNTLVTYPTIPRDYSSVKPISRMINLVRKLHADGHTIIIYTARRMGTHNHNVGSVIADIGKVTFDTLDKFEIPYHELIFGKPLGDVYIDDRAFNPYDDRLFKLIGEFSLVNDDIDNLLPNNKFHMIKAYDDYVYKSFLPDSPHGSGELFYYQHLPHFSDELKALFPKFHGAVMHPDGRIDLKMEKISGIPISFMYLHGTFSLALFNSLLNFANLLHTTRPTPKSDSIDLFGLLDQSAYAQNYMPKLKLRFQVCNADFNFPEAQQLYDQIAERVTEYVESGRMWANVVPLVHGDFWFSNILLTSKGDQFKFLDMRGVINGQKTMSGDRCGDYAKILQSLMGFDHALYGFNWDETRAIPFVECLKSFLAEQTQNAILFKDVVTVCAFVVFGALPFHNLCLERKSALITTLKKILEL